MGIIKWIKMTTNMFEDEKIRLIDALPDRDTIHYVWIRLLVQAGKTNANGFIFLNENIPYTDEMLSTLFCRPLSSIRLALKTLKDFEMIEIDEDNFIKISNWDKHQNVQGMERVREQTKRRVENYRGRKKQIEQTKEQNGEMVVQKSNITKVSVDNFKENSKISKNSSIQSSQENSCNALSINCNATNNSCSVIENESNVTVTEQNKRESKNKKENKNKIKKESESNITGDINKKNLETQETENYNSTHTHSQETKELSNSNNFNVSYTHKNNFKENVYEEAAELLKHYEEITGIIGGLNLGAIKLAISMHGKKYVKMAIDRALEVNKPEMTYINGILKNWRREGYPKEKEVNNNGVRSNGKSNTADKNEFGNFKAKKPRSLTESQRKGTEENLI